jgi:hypothetical protein
MGKVVKCLGCGKTFTAEVAAAERTPFPPVPAGAYEGHEGRGHRTPMPPPEQPEPPRPAWEELPEEPAESDETLTWRAVDVGLFLQTLGHYLYQGAVGTMFIVFLVVLAASEGRPGGGGRALQIILSILIILAILAYLGNLLLSIIGPSYWLTAPQRRQARSLAVGIVILATFDLFRAGDLFNVMLSGVHGFGDEPLSRIASLSGLLMLVAADAARLTLLAFFANALARIARDGGLAGNSRALAFATPAIFGGVWLVVLLLLLFAPPTKVVVILIEVMFTAAYSAILIWGFFTLGRTRQVVHSRLLTGSMASVTAAESPATPKPL